MAKQQINKSEPNQIANFFNVRENSGSVASNRFDFQKDWAICKILELHQGKTDYMLTLEFHDDISVFNSSMKINKVSFYQVKTSKKSHYTINSLLSSMKDKQGNSLGSFIGKLYLHLHKREDITESINFITNIPIEGTLANNNKCQDAEHFCCDDLSKEDLENIETKLKKEFKTQQLKPFQKITHFKQARLDIHNHSDTTKGKLATFLDTYLKNVKYQINPVYKTIFDDIKTKSNNEYSINNFEELKQRSITRDKFDGYLQDVKKKSENTINGNTTSIEHRLNTEFIDFKFVRRFREKSREYEIKNISPDNNLKLLLDKVDKEVQVNETGGSLYEIMEKIYSNISLSELESTIFESDFIKTVILHRIYE